MNNLPQLVRGYEPRPFGEWVREAHELGFDLVPEHDERRFEVTVHLLPRTRKTQTAVDLMANHGDSCVTVKTVYDKASAEMAAHGIEPPPREDHAKVVALGFDDAASEALRMAREAIRALESLRG